jgi:putative transposase
MVGWAMSDRMTSELALNVLRMAVQQREVGPALLHHSDQGSQYTSGECRQMLSDRGVEVSMNGAGTWYDRAPMEPFFGTLKGEWTHHRTYRTRGEARGDLLHYIEAFYNRRRLPSSIGDASPASDEQLCHQESAIASPTVHRIGGGPSQGASRREAS